MSPEQHTILREELLLDPLNFGYSTFLPQAPGKVVELLNAATRTVVKLKFVTARGVLAEIPEGAQLLDKLEHVSTSIPEVKWAMKFLITDGIDIGHSKTRMLLDQLSTAGIITQQESSYLKDLALQPGSRAEELGLPTILESDISLVLDK